MNEERVAKLKALLEKDPADSFTRYALALEYAGHGDIHIAVAYLQELLERDPSYLPAYQQLGYNYDKLDRKADAIAILSKGIALASQQGDQHARSEMQEVLDELR